ncbi:MAG TPA: TraV family lipoprotein [Burkholderiaceae bacterium]|nr:TraV family lipoprotein [Burkholderiaceae bacterium]
MTIAGGALLSGCTNISGLDARPSYSCAAPEGVACQSMSGVYENSIRNRLPSQQPRSAPSGNAAPSIEPAQGASARTSYAPAGTPTVGMPLRTPPRLMRLWVKTWEDEDRDLHGESLVYLQLDAGRWLAEHTQREARQAYAPIRTGIPAPPVATVHPPQANPVPMPAPGPAAAPSLAFPPGAPAAVPDAAMPLRTGSPLPNAALSPSEASVQEVLQALRESSAAAEANE